MERRPTITSRNELERLVQSHPNSIRFGEVEGRGEVSAFSLYDIGNTDACARGEANEDLYKELKLLEATHITEPVINLVGE